MSVHVSSWVWRHAKCDGNELLALVALADMADDDGECWANIRTLAQRCRCDERTVQRNLKAAQERGEIEIIPRLGENGDSLANVYRFKALGGGGNLPGVAKEKFPLPSSSPLSLHSLSSSSSVSSTKETSVLAEEKNNKKLKLSLDLVLGLVPPDLTLQSAAFLSAWQAWIKNRLQLRNPTLGSFEEHMTICKRLGETRAISAIRHSIASCYLSIYEPRQNQKTNDRDRIGASL